MGQFAAIFAFRVEKAGIGRAGALGALQAKCWQAAYKGLLPARFLRAFTTASRKDAMRMRMETVPGGEYYIARVWGRKAGFLVLAPSQDEDGPQSGEITALYLLPEFWGQGYGGRLMRFALARLGQLGYRTVTLWVLEDNHTARDFYTHMGFAPDGGTRTDNFGKDTRQCLRYRLGLPTGGVSAIIND